MKNLAIIIPAYKITFLEEALLSIANQTCQNFTLYIGDDCSPNDLYSIVSTFEGRIDLVYKRFEENLGGKDLVSQWERCVDMSKGEQWIWLFSDDDIMAPNCVEAFYNCINTDDTELLHFNVEQIGEDGEHIKTLPKYPLSISPKQYLDMKLNGEIYSYVIEFIFSRNLFEKNGRFENFDLAWGTDFITWLKLAEANSRITTISEADVKWRSSSENISPNKTNIVIVRKIKSLIDNVIWIKKFINRNGYYYSFFYYKFFFGEMLRERTSLTLSDVSALTTIFSNQTGMRIIPKLYYIYWKHFIKDSAIIGRN